MKFAIPIIILLISTSASAQNRPADIGFDHGWCIGRANLILSVFPSNRAAQDVAYNAERSFVVDGLSMFGATSQNRSRLTQAVNDVRNQAIANARNFILQNGRTAAENEINARLLPEMLRRCQY